MNTVSKIAILISWPRELDMFSVFVENISDEVVIIVDDFHYAASERVGNARDIIELVDGKIDYVLLSEVLGKLKYKILVTTAQAIQEKVTYSSFLKYIYAISTGRFVNYSGLSHVFLKTIGRPLTGNGKHANKFGSYQIEKKIGEKVVRYPKGLDISVLRFPEKKWKDVFDIYLCHSNIDQDLIKNSFSDAKCINIGYPRYDNAPLIADAKDIIYNEIDGIDPTKPLLLWMPTLIKMQGVLIDNIKVWLPAIKKLLDRYNVLIRLHPKLVVIDSNISNHLIRMGFVVDVKKDRNLSVLYQSADLVLADYGGSVLSAIYMKKKLILLNVPNSKYNHWREKRKYTDFSIRDDVRVFNVNDGVALIEAIDRDVQCDNSLIRGKLKEKYFGNESEHKDMKEVFYELTKELHN